MVLLVSGALATSVLFTADAFFAFAGWRYLIAKKTWSRDCVKRLHSFTEKRAPFIAAIAMAVAILMAVSAGLTHPRAACLATGAFVALGTHLLLYVRTACLVRSMEAAQQGSAEWHVHVGKVEAAMVTRASLQAAAFICLVAAGMVA